MSGYSNDFARRNARPGMLHERIEREVGEFAARRYGGHAVKIGADRLHEDIPAGQRRDDCEFLVRTAAPDFAITDDPSWWPWGEHPRDGYVASFLGSVRVIVEVKASRMTTAAGWYISQSQMRGFRELQLALEADVCDAYGVSNDDELLGFADELAVPFYLALVHSDAPHLVSFLPWRKAERMARKTAVIEQNDAPTLKWIIPAAEVRSERWIDMRTGEESLAPAPVITAAREASAPLVWMDTDDPAIVAFLDAFPMELFTYEDPASGVPITDAQGDLLLPSWGDVVALARCSRSVARTRHHVRRLLAEQAETEALVRSRGAIPEGLVPIRAGEHSLVVRDAFHAAAVARN